MRRLLLVLLLFLPATLSSSEFCTPDSTAIRKAVEQFPDSVQEELFSSLVDAAGNWNELLNGVLLLPDSLQDDAIWLINRMPHLDRLEMTHTILAEHVLYSHKTKQTAPYSIPDSLFRRYILTYRIYEEPVEGWRKPLFERFSPVLKEKKSIQEVARYVNNFIADSIKEGKSSFFSGMKPPLLVLKSRRGTKTEISLLATAILKTLGIPARRVYNRYFGEEKNGASWVEIFDGESWIPVYLDNPSMFGNFTRFERNHPHNITFAVARGGFEIENVTSHYTTTGELSVRILRNGKPVPDFEQFAISVLNNGGHFPIDEVGTATDSNGLFTVELGDGKYLVEVGQRDASGSVLVQTFPVEITPAETTRLDIELEKPLFLPEKKPADGILPAFTLPKIGTGSISYKTSEKKDRFFVFLGLNEEPTERMLPILLRFSEENKDSIEVLWLVNKEEAQNSILPKTAVDKNFQLLKILVGDNEKEKIELPVIIFVGKNSNRYTVISQGYDLNIEEKLKQTIKR
ncbi:transglutaminase domain-containing protein [bacterium]|nr:transglutaminase domain-containing protein [bacterium]